MSRTLAPLAVSMIDRQIVIMPSKGNWEVEPGDVNLSEEGIADPTCTTTGSDGVAVCKIFQPLVMFVGGAMDADYRPQMQVFQRYDAPHESYQDVGYCTWDTRSQLKAIALHWLTKGQKVVLVGHSFGGASAMAVAKALSDMGKEVELLVTLDPVYRGGAQPKPAKVKTWLNVYVDYDQAEHSGGLMGTTANDIALKGGPWQHCDEADRNVILSYTRSDAHAMAYRMFANFQSDVEAVI